VVTEVEALAKVEATWPELDSWRVRLGEPFAPEIGSELEVDHVDWPPMPVAQVAWDGLISAVMHLHAVRIHLEPSSPAKPELVPLAQATLGRSALIGAAQAVWVLAPGEPQERQRRARTCARSFLEEHRKFLKVVDASDPEPHEGTRVLIEYTDTRLAELDALRAGDGQRGSLNTTDVITQAARVAFLSRPALQNEVLMMWRSSSGAAHGLTWSVLGGPGSRQPTPEESATPPGPASESVLVTHRRGGDMVGLANLYLAAHRLAAHGWHLLKQRGSSPTG
jgi:hypothetical protein